MQFLVSLSAVLEIKCFGQQPLPFIILLIFLKEFLNTWFICLGSLRGNTKQPISNSLNTFVHSILWVYCGFPSPIFKNIPVKHFWTLPMFQNVRKSLFTQQPFVRTIKSFYSRHNVQNIATRISPIPINNFNSRTFQLLNS